MNLYEISAIFRKDAERLAELDLDEVTIQNTLESMAGDLEVKAQNVVFFARNLQATADAIKQAEDAMARRRTAIENRSKHLLKYVKGCMETAQVSKIECPFFRLSIAKSPPAVDVYEPGLLPAKYMRQPETPPAVADKKAIAEAIKIGTEVPGARLTQGTRLAIN